MKNKYTSKDRDTGFSDKNGKPIFKGSILEINGEVPDTWQMSHEDGNTGYAIVGFDDGVFTIGESVDRNSHGLSEWHIETMKLEVVGDIFRNPELLEKAQ